MLLVIDVGNTNTVLGVFRGNRLIENWRLTTRAPITADEYGIQIKELFSFSGIDPTGVKGIIISNVVPPSMDPLQQMCKKYFGHDPLIVGPGVRTGMPILYDNPHEVGADRIVNAVAGYEKYKKALILIDFGTATTLDCVSAKGEFMGGAIAPGLQISVEALIRSASKLFRVELALPRSVIGKNTAQSMQAGILYGYIGLVDELVERAKKEMHAHPKVIATGGLAPLIAPESRTIEVVEEFLTLEGLRIIYERNIE